MSDIPAAREIIEALAKSETCPIKRASLNHAISLMKRGRVKPRRAPTKSQPMNASVAAAMRSLAASTSLSNQEIANRFGVNPGRVTEALEGRW